jgi:hypothetical protein
MTFWPAFGYWCYPCYQFDKITIAAAQTSMYAENITVSCLSVSISITKHFMRSPS